MCVFVSKKGCFTTGFFEISCYDKSSKNLLEIRIFALQLCSLLVDISRIKKIKVLPMAKLLEQIDPLRNLIKKAR